MAICYSQSDQFNSRSNRTTTGKCRSLPRTRQGENMPILLKTQVESADKTPVTVCRARVGGLCRFRRPAERVPAGSPKTGRCTAVRERWRKMLVLARTAAGKAACDKRGNTPKRAKSRDFGRCGEKAGESQGVVRAPWQTHLPAVRAVWGFRVGVVERAKTAPLGSEAEIVPLFQGKQRGHTQNWREISMANRKIKFLLWLMPETKATVERL